MNSIVFGESGSVSEKKRVIIKELVEGHEAATQLKLLLENPFENEAAGSLSLSSQHLMANVLRSFSQALSIINSSSSKHDDVANYLKNSGENGLPVAGSGSDPTSGGCSEKRSQKGRRGRYLRRKNAQTWTRLSCTTVDYHAWRKYGQKGILNSEFPRSYYRCSHKYDEGCGATKQVQVDEENPNMYRTTYIGLHTCNATPMATHLAIAGSKLPKFEDHHITSPSNKEDTPSDDVTDHGLDPNLWLDFKDFQPSKPTINVPLNLDSDHNNIADYVYSCTDSQLLDMDFGLSVHFGTDFPL